MKASRNWWVVAFVLGLVSLGLGGMLVALLMPSGIHVKIRNAGATSIRSVVLHVTGASYKLGDIAPGATAESVVRSTGESGLEIEFTGTDGQTNRLNAGGYFEPGYRGTIRVSIKDGVIDKNEQQINVR